MSELKAVVWDYDGTLVDTEPVWAGTEQAMMLDFGVVWTDEHMLTKIGQHADISARQMAEDAGQPERADWFFAELHERVARTVASAPLPYLPGVEALIRELADAGVRCAIVTASNGQIIDAARSRLPEVFEFIVTSDDVTHPKPHPEAYTLAFERLGLTPEEALVLEDSVPGATSALGAGAYVLGVPRDAQLDAHPRLEVSPDALATTDLARLRAVHRRLQEAR